MKNEHLLPVNIIDLVEKYRQPNLRENERMSYQLRLETIRDYVDQALKTKPVVFPSTRKKNNFR